LQSHKISDGRRNSYERECLLDSSRPVKKNWSIGKLDLTVEHGMVTEDMRDLRNEIGRVAIKDVRADHGCPEEGCKQNGSEYSAIKIAPRH